MVISQSKKSEFKSFEEIASNVYDFRWGKEDVVEKVGKFNEETGEWELTGEVKETDLCTYELHRFIGSKPTPHMMTYYFNKGQRIPSMADMKTIGGVLGMSNEQIVPWMKEQLKRAIKKHDKSRGENGVENFTINGINLWLDKDTRTGLQLRFAAEKATGKTDTVLWHEGLSFPLVIDSAIQMLYALEVYASETYDQTAAHSAEVDKLDSVEELLAYDETRKTGYPQQLAF